MFRSMRVRGVLPIVALLLFLPLPATASVMHLVDAMDSLFFTDWGHPYNVPPFDSSNNEFGALGRGAPAEVVSNLGSPTDFAGFSAVEVTASGSNAINGALAFGPDGISGSFFRALPVYSLIGVWSSSSSSIVPLGTAFFVGSSASLAVPSSPSAFLWLGFNDGIFEDNLDAPSPGFLVVLNAVPEPTMLGLLAPSLGLLLRRRV